MTDVLIAGAGPAGAIAALILARAGVNVTMFDRATFPRDKLCGDTVNPGALRILERLGLQDVTAGGVPIDGMTVTGEGDVRVTGAYPGGQHGIAIRRRVLDEHLVQAAVAAGARLVDATLVQAPITVGARVTGVEVSRVNGGATERHTARVTIAADGRFSRVARALQLVDTPAHPRRWAIGSVFANVTGLTSYGEMHVRRHCYIGIAPLPAGLANACVVTADRQALRTRNLLLGTLRAEPRIASRFTSAEMLEPPAVLGPLALDAHAAGTPGLLLAGDAAGFIDPMTGDGLRFAFRGAELAAEAALYALAHGADDAHERLARARVVEFGAKWRFNRALRRLVASPSSVRAAAAGARVFPAAVRYAVTFAGDAARA